jgi:serine protease
MKTTSLVLASMMAAVTISTALAVDKTRVLVEFKAGQKEVAKGLLKKAGGAIHYEFDELNAVAVTLPGNSVKAIQSNPNITLVEQDPPRYLYSDTVPYGVDMVGATAVWDVNGHGAPTGAGIKVGVIDSGIYTGHEDFADVSAFGYPSDWNVDRDGHGTHVCGTITASLNKSGVVGVSPGDVQIYMVKVFGDTGSWVYSSTLIDAANRCAAAGSKIISMSLGGPVPSGVENKGFDRLYKAGILLVAAAGNDGNTRTSYPAGYASVVSVAAVDSTKAVASFSQQNKDVELAAPGVGVLSTVPYVEANTVTVGNTTVQGEHIEFSARGTVTGALVDGGLGDTENPAWTGKVVLVQRGSISFYDKVINVQNSGGVACIIYNNVPGGFLGTLGDGNSSTIPAISISDTDGLVLAGKVGQTATVSSSVTLGSGYAYYDGTSMATPHVSGVAALIWSGAPGKSNVEVRTALQRSAEDLGAPGRDTSYGFGLINAVNALQYLRTH